MTEIQQKQINNWFSYHSPKYDQPKRYQEIRNKAKELAEVIIENCPISTDTTTALQKLRECVMTANASIACYE